MSNTSNLNPTALEENRTDEIEASLIKAFNHLLRSPVFLDDEPNGAPLHEGIKINFLDVDTYTINETLLCDVDVRIDMTTLFERVIGFKPVWCRAVVNISFDECCLDKHSGRAKWNSDQYTLNYGHYSKNIIWKTDTKNIGFQEGEVYGLTAEDDQNLISGVMEAIFINNECVQLFWDTVAKHLPPINIS